MTRGRLSASLEKALAISGFVVALGLIVLVAVFS